ncbi:MAG: DUF58 domain-containing protein [Phycisphaerae bacterium]
MTSDALQPPTQPPNAQAPNAQVPYALGPLRPRLAVGTRRNQHRLKQTPLRRRPSLDFSLTGLIYCSMMMFMGLAAINSQANLLFGVFGLMIGILLVSGIISRLVLRKLFVTRTIPTHAVVGQPVQVMYEIANRKRFWPSLSVTLSELDGVEAFTKQPHAYLLHAAARTTALVPCEVTPKRRGVHEMGAFQLSTSFPFGFIKRAVDGRQPDSFLAFPPLGGVDPRLVRLLKSAESTGSTNRPRAGGQDEFFGVREYRQGDSPRTIYWRRSLRTGPGGPMVAKMMSRVSPPRILLVVDTQLHERTFRSHARVERAIAMAASLADTCLRDNLSVGVVAWSDEVIQLPPNRGKRHRRELLDALARLKLNRSVKLDELLDAAGKLGRSGTTLVVFTPGAEDAVSRAGEVPPADANAPAHRQHTTPPTRDRPAMPAPDATAAGTATATATAPAPAPADPGPARRSANAGNEPATARLAADTDRRGMLTITAAGPNTHWFDFNPAVDFETCCPDDQQPEAPQAG